MWWDFKLHLSWCQSLSDHDEWAAVIYVVHCFYSLSRVTVCYSPVLLSQPCPPVTVLSLMSWSSARSVHVLWLNSSCKYSAESVHTHRLSGQNSGCSSLLPCSRNTVMSKEFTSEYGGAPRVISSHSNTPKDHCGERGCIKLSFYVMINRCTFRV